MIDGPERRPTTTSARERVVIEHADGDTFGSKLRADIGPQTRMTRAMSCKVTIYAQVPTTGAAEWEHRRRAEAILDCVLISLDIIAKGRKNIFLPKSGKFIYPEDLKESETPGGAVYELSFTFDRGVANITWPTTTQGTGVAANADGSVQKTAEVTDDNTGVTIVNTTKVSADGSTPEDVN